MAKDTNTDIAIISNDDIKNKIYTIRGMQVMLDSDLAELYQVETKNLNKASNRNVERFPEDFRFKLTKEEFENLRFQTGTSSESYGGRRYMPYVYTEQGISMLASVLRSKIAIQVSINIMRTFIEMRHFIANNAALFERISSVELRQLEYQKQTDKKLDVKYTNVFHDRFLILDGKTVYHIGASLKDAGKKCFGITLMKDAGSELMKKLAKT